MNRYTQLSSSTFNPLSYEEMSVLPAMRNKQHVTMMTQLDALKNLPAQMLDTLPGKPTEYAKAVTSELDTMINNVTEELNNKGYSNAIMGDVLKLNNKYQQLLGANGDLGKLNAQKKAYLKDREEFLKKAEKANFSDEEAVSHWNRMQSNFTGFDAEGNIAQHNPVAVPERLDVFDFAKDIQGMVGQFKEVLNRAGGGSYDYDDDGNLVIVNRSGQVHRVSNIPGLRQAEQLFNETFLNPNGKGFRSNEFRNINPLQSKIEFTRLLNMMVKDETTDTRSESISVKETELSKAKAEAMMNPNGPNSIQASVNTVQASKRYKNFAELENRYNELQGRVNEASNGGKALTQAEAVELKELNQYMANFNSLMNEEGMTGKMTELNNLDNQYSEKLGFNVNDVQSKILTMTDTDVKFEYVVNGKPLTKEQTKEYKEYLKKSSGIKKEKYDVANKLFGSTVIQSDSYNFVKTGYDTKQDRIIEQSKRNLINSLLANNSDKSIVSVRPADLNNNDIKLTNEEEEQLRAALAYIDPDKTGEVVDVEHRNGQTVYKVTIKPDAMKDSLVLSRFLSKSPDLNKGFQIEIGTSRTANELGIGTAHNAMLNAPQDPLDRQLTSEMRVQNAAYRFGNSTGDALTASDVYDIASGGYGIEGVQKILGGATTQDVTALVNEAQQTLINNFYNYLSKSTESDGTNSLTKFLQLEPEIQEQIKEDYIKSKSKTTLIGY